MRAFVVTGALVIPGSIGAGDPWLAAGARPETPYLLESGSHRDALVSLDVRNTTDRPVRVERLKIEFLSNGSVVGTLDPATAVFTGAGLFSDPRVEPGEPTTWSGLCLEPPAANVDLARLTLSLVQRRGLRSTRSSQVVEVPLRAPASPESLTLPVRGTWRVTQGHTCDSQHRRGRLGGEYAWDLVAINESGRSGNPGYEGSHRISDSATYGRDVLSPVDGAVVATSDGVPDNDLMTDYPRKSLIETVRNPKWIFGNHVVIRDGEAFVLLGHLKRGSISVHAGDQVRVGTPVGKAGNSGNTILPHVHIQVMDRPDAADPHVSGLPAVFKDFFEVTARRTGQEGEAVFKRVAAGDPPLGAVLITPRPDPPPR